MDIRPDHTKRIWTIGHSTRSFEDFVFLLKLHGISLVADIRFYPGSRNFPHYNKEHLGLALPQNDIKYIHLKPLGGRRTPLTDSINTRWRNAAFRGFADYMQTEDFKTGISLLEKMGAESSSACMCSEAVWWRCHRSLLADYLKIRGWTVLHIMGVSKLTEHPYTSASRIENEKLFYSDKKI
jgi:uncharacterized protein (DUF488 family)